MSSDERYPAAVSTTKEISTDNALYSCRSAVIGSTDAARLAGTRQASSADEKSVSATTQ